MPLLAGDWRQLAQANVNDIREVGLEVDNPIKEAVTETNYVGVAQQMKNAGDDAFITSLDINGISKLAEAIKQVGLDAEGSLVRRARRTGRS